MGFPQQWEPKWLMECLNSQGPYVPDNLTRRAIADLVGILQLHRPMGSNGKHGDLHTPTCGCGDKLSRDDMTPNFEVTSTYDVVTRGDDERRSDSTWDERSTMKGQTRFRGIETKTSKLLDGDDKGRMKSAMPKHSDTREAREYQDSDEYRARQREENESRFQAQMRKLGNRMHRTEQEDQDEADRQRLRDWGKKQTDETKDN